MVPFLAMAKFELCLSMAYRKSCIMLFTLQQDCNTRVACRLLFVVKVVQVVFPYSAGKHTRWLSTQQAAFPPPLHFIAHYRTGSHGSASHRTTGEEKSHNFALGNAYRQARDQESQPTRTSSGRARIPKPTRRRPEDRSKPRPHHPHPSNHRRRPRRSGREQGPGRLTSKGQRDEG